ncbi:MAG: hypothetical protein ACJ74H_15940 [Thermoanaerobaculia bacterium]
MRQVRCFFFFLFFVSPLFASSSAAIRPPWTWTAEERIAKRLDPKHVRDRVMAHARPATFVIDGRFDSALFMPWELMERFLNATDAAAPHRDASRARYTDDIVAFGWSTTSFWRDLDEASAAYAGMRNRIRQMRTAPASETDIADRFCLTRAQALQNARARFGYEQFDRFLYEVIAPGLTMFSDDPMTAEQLLWVERGCK